MMIEEDKKVNVQFQVLELTKELEAVSKEYEASHDAYMKAANDSFKSLVVATIIFVVTIIVVLAFHLSGHWFFISTAAFLIHMFVFDSRRSRRFQEMRTSEQKMTLVALYLAATSTRALEVPKRSELNLKGLEASFMN